MGSTSLVNVVVGNEPPPSSSFFRSGTWNRYAPVDRSHGESPIALNISNTFPKKCCQNFAACMATWVPLFSYGASEREIEIVVESNWDSLGSIRNFAGPDVEAAVVAPEAAAVLTSFDRRALHSEFVLTRVPNA